MKDNILFGPHIDLNEFDLPILIFTGRSNVGKSSIIRLITGKKLRIGKKSGTTVIPIAIYMKRYWIVDLPGIGFANNRSKVESFQISKSVIDFIERHMDSDLYSFIIEDISTFPNLYNKLLKRNIKPIAILLYEYLKQFSKNTFIIMNKIDKIKRQNRVDVLDSISIIFGMARWMPKSHFIIPFSSKSKEGLFELRQCIETIKNRK